MSTKTGRLAENAAAQYLQRQGYAVLAQNWRTRWCEIDLVMQKASRVLFVEVKYRANANFGSGLDYITSKKLQQMHFAAEFWLGRHGQQDNDYALAAIELTGQPPTVAQFVEDV